MADRTTEHALELIGRIRSALDDAELTAVHANLSWPPPDLPPHLRDHITRWSPDAVLRLVDALRRIVDQIHIVRPFLTEPAHQNYAYVIDWNLRMLARGLGIDTEESR